jgi:hydrogenase maturation protease
LARIAVIGIGNVLMGDDAVGPHVVRTLEALHELPPEVEVIDAGTPGLDLTAYMAGKDALVIVDAVQAKGAPGEIRLYDKASILEKPPPLSTSPHEPSLRASLHTAEFAGEAPREVTLVGVVPGPLLDGVGLSAPVRAAVPAAIAEVLAQLRRHGVEVRERAERGSPDLWWEDGHFRAVDLS